MEYIKEAEPTIIEGEASIVEAERNAKGQFVKREKPTPEA